MKEDKHIDPDRDLLGTAWDHCKVNGRKCRFYFEWDDSHTAICALLLVQRQVEAMESGRCNPVENFSAHDANNSRGDTVLGATSDNIERFNNDGLLRISEVRECKQKLNDSSADQRLSELRVRLKIISDKYKSFEG